MSGMMWGTSSDYQEYCRKLREDGDGGTLYCGYCGRPIDMSRYWLVEGDATYHRECVEEMERYGGTD